MTAFFCKTQDSTNHQSLYKLPNDVWLCHKLEKLSITLMEGYHSTSFEAPQAELEISSVAGLPPSLVGDRISSPGVVKKIPTTC